MTTTSSKVRTKSTENSADNTATPSTSDSSSLNLKSAVLAGGELGQLQEILVGKQLRTNSEQLDILQQHMEEQLASMQANHARQLAELQSRLDMALTEVDKRLTGDMQTQNDALEKRVEAGLLKLNEQKLDRDALSSLLGGVATQLTQQSSEK